MRKATLRLTAHTEGEFLVYTVHRVGEEPFGTTDPAEASARLAEMGVESPEGLVEQVRQWRVIEIAEPRS